MGDVLNTIGILSADDNDFYNNVFGLLYQYGFITVRLTELLEKDTTVETKNFARDILEYQNNNGSADVVLEMIEAVEDGRAISIKPFVKVEYPIDKNLEPEDESDYPIITQVLRDELPKMTNDPNLNLQ